MRTKLVELRGGANKTQFSLKLHPRRGFKCVNRCAFYLFNTFARNWFLFNSHFNFRIYKQENIAQLRSKHIIIDFCFYLVKDFVKKETFCNKRDSQK
jgi:hypothetical protein